MHPTYSLAEIKKLIRSFDTEEISILNDLVLDEINEYPLYESRAILRMILLRKRALAQNEVQLAYLLAYN